ncbi:MAG: DUF4173 domain-containing protein [Actinobacteria bacterium]|nr:DUF4173 domain-containing protein [Actinomycetota bacterium]
MLRLFVVTFAVWVGAVFVLLAFRLAGMGGDRRWFAPAAVSVGLVLVFLLNAIDPEATVVRRNGAGPDFDPAYASTLSDDAVRRGTGRSDGRRRCGRSWGARRSALAKFAELAHEV